MPGNETFIAWKRILAMVFVKKKKNTARVWVDISTSAIKTETETIASIESAWVSAASGASPTETAKI